MAAATPTSSLDLLDLLHKSRIWPDAELKSRLAELGPVPDEPRLAAGFLIEQGLLTAFQARILLGGKYRGFRLGAYVIRSQIGKGGMGAVYLGHHEALRRPVAIKVLTPPDKSAVTEVSVERFLREARSAAALDHPNIVRIFDVAQHGEMHYLVMEYVEGQTLDQMVAVGGPVACGRAVEYMLQAAAGLEHAYQKGFVHRDIKPANLILSKDGTVKILDMGLARSEEAEDQVTEVFDKGAVVGTADYISPEQAMNAPDLDIRADIYSLGATFYTLLTGRPPFSGNTTQKLMQHQIKEAPPLDALDKTFPPDLARVVAKMMMKRPAERYQTPAEVMAALGPWLSNTSQVVAALSRVESRSSVGLQQTLNEVVSGTTKRLNAVPAEPAVARRPSRRPYVVGGAVVAVVLAAFGGVAAYALSGPSEKAVVVIQLPPQAPTLPAPAPTATRRPPTPKPPAATRAAAIFSFDAAGQADFRETWRGEVNKNGGSDFPTQVVTETSGGKLPEGWKRMNYKAGTVSEVAVEAVGGAKGFRMGTLGGPRSTMIFTPIFAANRPKLKLALEYRIEGTAGSALVKFARTSPALEDSAWDITSVPATDGEWVRREYEFESRGASEGRVEFHTRDLELGTMLWAKSVTVSDAAPGKPAPAKAARPSVVASFDAATLTPFRERFRTAPKASDPKRRENTVLRRSGDGQRPAGWWHENYKDDAVGELAVESVGGVKAFGFATLEGEKTTMLFTPPFGGRASGLVVTVVYRTESSTGQGLLKFRQTAPPLASGGWEVGKLPATGGQWATREFPLDGMASAEGQLEFHSGGLELGQMLWVRSYTVSAASPEPARAADAGSPSFAFDAKSLADFREQFRTTPDQAKPGSYDLVVLGRTGDGKLPEGWTRDNYLHDTVTEVAVDSVGGAKALGLTRLSGASSSMLITAPFGVTDGSVTAKVEYSVEGTEGESTLRLVGSEPTRDVAKLPATDGKWVTREFAVGLKPSDKCRLEFHTASLPVGKTLWVKSLSVSGRGGAAEAPAAAEAVAPGGGKVLYFASFDKLKPYREVSSGTKLEDGAPVVGTVLEREGDGRLPADWGPAWSWNRAAVQEFRAAVHNGSMGLGFKTVSGKSSTMLFAPAVEFPDGAVRVRLEYAAGGGSANKGHVRFRQTLPTFGEVYDAADVPTTGDAWETADFALDTHGATGGVLEFHTSKLPLGETFWLKSVTVYQPAE